jgi:hypothetical protein
MQNLRAHNPFAKRDSYGKNAILAYRVLTPFSWLLVVVIGIYYSIHKPTDTRHGRTVWEQAKRKTTPFSQDTHVTGVYWIVLLLSQLGYIAQLFSSNAERVAAAANVAGYYILNNLFVLSFILLWVRNYFWGAEIIDIANLVSQSIVYWKNRDLPPVIHLPAVAGPYAWTVTTMFWNGAVAVGGDNATKRIVANIFIWAIFLFGQSHITHQKDYTFGYALSVLMFSLALKQFNIKTFALQWIFAFVIFGVFLVSSLHAHTTKCYNRDFFFRRITEPEPADRERQPLLSDS